MAETIGARTIRYGEAGCGGRRERRYGSCTPFQRTRRVGSARTICSRGEGVAVQCVCVVVWKSMLLSENPTRMCWRNIGLSHHSPNVRRYRSANQYVLASLEAACCRRVLKRQACPCCSRRSMRRTSTSSANRCRRVTSVRPYCAVTVTTEDESNRCSYGSVNVR